ncbi:MAG: hypothetical protein WCP97_00950 [bacterium]
MHPKWQYFVFILLSLTLVSYFAVLLRIFGTLHATISENIKPQPISDNLLLWTIIVCAAYCLMLLLTRRYFTVIPYYYYWIAPVFALIISTATYPRFADDILIYVMHARTIVLYGMNPYITLPETVEHSRLAELTTLNITNVYGPVWTFISIIPTLIAQKNLLINIILMKVLVILLFLSTAATLDYHNQREKIANRIMLLVAVLWNPLLLVDIGINGHNEAVMMFFLVVAIILLLHHKKTATFITFSIAVLTKYIPILLLPLLFIKLTKNSKKIITITQGIAILLATAIISFTPFANKKIFYGIYEQSTIVLASFFSLSGALHIPFIIGECLFYSSFVTITFLVWKGKRTTLWGIYHTILWYLIIGTKLFHP